MIRGNYQSHGPQSCLYEHLSEVMQAAQSLPERIACACHDMGKATSQWQAYIRGDRDTSPHSHSLCGALLANSIIRTLQLPDATEHAAIAFHAIAAHHGILYAVPADSSTGDLYSIYADKHAQSFFLYAAPRLLPEIDSSVLTTAWNSLADFINDSDDWAEWKDALADMDSATRTRIFFASRSMLGRLCAYDQASAEKQSCGLQSLPFPPHYQTTSLFQKRLARDFSARAVDPLQSLRCELGHAVELMARTSDSIFFLICAPTGTGKTEAMLKLAERLQFDLNAARIVYAVPQISLCDQIFIDYLHNADAQIWNHLRREYAQESAREQNNNDIDAYLETAASPFGSSYNITTFNQVLFAALHPHRFQCIKSAELSHSIVILDEFHKIPLTIQPFVFRLLEQFANDMHCRFILGSATPASLPHLAHPPAVLSEKTTAALYNAPVLLNRRAYRFIGKMKIDAVFDRIIDRIACQPDANHLVVLNLIGSGTHPLREMLGLAFDPWERLNQFRSGESGYKLVLDGLVPPALRRSYIETCKKAMTQKLGVTLISTQMIEVGVDLDFDTGLLDYQGIAATLQRAGRVGREARGAEPCPVDIFCLEPKDDETSFAILMDVARKHDIRRHVPAFAAVMDSMHKLYLHEMNLFNQWVNGRSFDETHLLAAWTELQQNLLNSLNETTISDLFRNEGACSPYMGYHFEDAQLLADIYGTEGGIQRTVLLWPDQTTWENAMNSIEEAKHCPACRHQVARLIADWSVTTSSPSIIDLMKELFQEQHPMLGRRCFVRCMDNIL